MNDPNSLPLDAAAEQRIRDFAKSEVFDRTYREGMVLVEETAAYLDGAGRAASRELDRLGALAYAAESMRLTTRLMQVASWLLVQRALREGEMQLSEACSAKYRLAMREALAPTPDSQTYLPPDLIQLIDRCERLFERVRRLDVNMYASAANNNAVNSQMALLRNAFRSENDA